MKAPKTKKAKPPPKPPRRWLAPVALAVLALCIYFFYFLDHLPRAASIRPGTRWPVEPTEQLRLHGLKDGTVLRLNFSDAAAAKLSFPPGTRLAADGEAARPPSPGPLEFNLFNAGRENAEIAVQISPSKGELATLVLEPRLPDPHLLSLRLRSEGAPLIVAVGIVGNPSATEHGQLQVGDEVLEEASLFVPAGAAFSIGLRTEQLAALRKEVGELEDGVQRLELSAVEIGTGAEDDFERRWLACGARRGRVLWQRPLPGLAIADCRPGRVSLVGLDFTGTGARADPHGAGFTVLDGTTQVWQGFREFRENDIVKALLGSLIVALLGWIVATIRGRKRR